jgi:Zn-dependent peptidase ImmA (M78 family)
MIPVINPKIQIEISKMSYFLATHFSNKGATDILEICRDENIKLIVDNYQHYFDGMLTWDGKRFHIHLNSHRGNTLVTQRGRFSLAHELGHYFIEYHNRGIRTGTIPMHASNLSLMHSDEIEREADRFAASLLMPKHQLVSLTGGKKFSLERIMEIATFFDVSLTAAILRFLEVGTHEIMAVFSKNGRIDYSVRSSDFPKLVNKFKRGDMVPATSVAGESFLKANAKHTGIELIEVDDWFEDRGWAPNRQLYEQCFYSNTYNSVVSILWFR